MKISKLIILPIALLLLSSFEIMGQDEWVVPENEKSKLANFEFDDQARAAGEELYMFNCRSCHGVPGQGNYINLVPSPGDPATDNIQNNLDGELYYKLRIGRGQMPSFRNVLSSSQIWQVIAYLRSFNDSYVQEIARKIEGEGIQWEDIEIIISILEGSGDIEARVAGSGETGPGPVPGAEIQLFAKRAFGNLLIEESVTNEKGIALFSKPEDVPGDPEGKVDILARLVNEEKYGTVIKDTAMTVGVPVKAVSLVEKRALWNSLSKAPYWVLISYILSVLVVWGLIFLIMVELRSIFKIGQYFEKND